MIVVDTNIISYLYLPTEFTTQAENLLLQEVEWVVPVLWRSEFRNVLALYIRKNLLSFEQACFIQNKAEVLFEGREFNLDSYDILQLIKDSDCSSYDCEFVALAKRLEVRLITMDKKLLSTFPKIAFSLISVQH